MDQQFDNILILDKGDYFLTNHRVNYRRGVIWLGQTCNQRCKFCYFADAIASKEHPEHAFASLDKAKEICKILRSKYNNNSVNIQGGEPTIYPYIYELVSYCKTIGLKPTLITNALVLDDIEKCKKFKEAGIFDFLISVHNIGEKHDEVVGVPNAHKRQLKAMSNLLEYNIPFRINTVLTNEVLTNLRAIAEIAVEHKARACNFIAFNMSPEQVGKRNKKNVPLCQEIKQALPKIIDYLDDIGIEVNIRYLPFCLFEKRHRKFVQNTKQTIYDIHEWEYSSRLWTQSKNQRQSKLPLSEPIDIFEFLMKKRLKSKNEIEQYFSKNPTKRDSSCIVREMTNWQKSMDQDPGNYQPLFFRDSLGPCQDFSIYDYAYCEAREITTVAYRYKKKAICNNCNLDGICDGFQKDYVDFWGDGEAVPVNDIGIKTYDPKFYMKKQLKIVEKEESSWALPNNKVSKVQLRLPEQLRLPLVSIIVTSFNYERYIENCLSGILNQSYRPIECIIVDDRSTDKSVQIITDFIKRNSNSSVYFRLIEHDINKGQLSAFITGITNAKGVFLAFVDADDILLPEAVNTHIQAHFSTNVAMTVTQQVEIGEFNEILSLYSNSSPQFKKQDSEELKLKSFQDLEKMIETKRFNDNNIKIAVLDINTHSFGRWHWGPTSNALFRKDALKYFVYAKNYSYWKHCADYLLFNYAHLIGGTGIIYAPMTAYRRHSCKGFSNEAITGIRRYFKQQSRDLIYNNRIQALIDILDILHLGKEQIMKSIDKDSYLDLIRLAIKNYSQKELEGQKKTLAKLIPKTIAKRSWKVKKRLW